ncbi:hypothetical protein U472_10700 [Orenia metallireducens]|uniref:Uncharacterized protein n=1 Tax=Orenia metallireducens TaxID=1413210 RepID=A0A1C0A8B6_9FIRM|nr:hypothetical protein [Orenia metallireducens]OCL26460.1 hypothetical protein U472_10700 [Orenia metallireducens]
MQFNQYSKEQQEYMLAVGYKKVIDDIYHQYINELREECGEEEMLEQELDLIDELDYWQVESRVLQAENNLINWGRRILYKWGIFTDRMVERTFDFEIYDKSSIVNMLMELNEEEISDLVQLYKN